MSDDLMERDEVARSVTRARPPRDDHARLIRATVAARLFRAPAEAVNVARFVLLERLGRGAMGDVFAAYDPTLDRKVAVKLVAGGGDAAAREVLLLEARTAARLSHPGVVTVHDAGEHGEGVYVAMELVRGVNLRSWVGEQRPWREVLVVARQIVRALAAAHRSDVLHRDIKPDNILVEERDGEPIAKITDFGLAIMTAATAATGRAGTPAYMAPEVLAGAPSTVAADQYACCVTLWEAFTRTRPDAERASDAAIPAWIALALRRGLDTDPARRHPSMEALGDALDADPRITRRRYAIAGGALAAAAAGAVITWSIAGASSTTDDACATAADDASALWSPERRATLVAAIGSATGFGEASASTAAGAIDRWVAAWRGARIDGCREARRGLRADSAHAAITACLDRQRIHAEQAIATLVQRGDVAAAAVDATARLPDPAACSVARGPAPPLDADARARHDELLARVARTTAALELGRADDAVVALGDAVVGATQLGHEGVRAAVLDAAGAIADRRGKHADAVALLERAALAGIAGNDPRSTARSAIRLVYVVAAGLRKPDDATRWIQMAEAALAAAGREPRMVATLHDHTGVAHVIARRVQPAIASHRKALETLDGAFGPEHPDRVRVLINLATALLSSKRPAEALPIFDEADALASRTYGAKHPLLGPLLTNRAMARWEGGDRAGVLADLERSLAIKEAASGPDHPSLSSTLTNIGLVLGELDRIEDAVAPLERAIRIRSRAHGPEHVTLVDPLVNLAVTYIELGRHGEALAAANRAIPIAAATGTPGATLYPLTLAAWAESDAGHAEPARALIARADAALATAAEVDPVERAHLDFVAARQLHAADPARATVRARAALAAFQADKRSPSSPRFARAVEAWIAAHR